MARLVILASVGSAGALLVGVLLLA